MTANPATGDAGGCSALPVGVVCDHGAAYRRIEYSATVLDDIRRRATDQFLAIPRGGLEVGGILYGTRTEDCVSILAFRELAIQYLTGPSFSLSPDDETQLARLLKEDPPAGPDGERLSVTGWWHSHTRSDISLSPQDIRIHQRFFGGSGSVALVIKPFKFDPARIAIYAPDHDATQPCCRFTLQQPDLPALLPGTAPLAGTDPVRTIARACDTMAVPAVGAAITVLASTPVVAQELTAPGAEKRTTGIRRSAVAAGLTLLFVAAGAFAVLHPSRTPEPIRLDLTDSPNGLIVHWNTAVRSIRDASSADLLIKDGNREARTVPLRADDLLSGTMTYSRKSGKVEVRLRVRSRNADVQEAVAHFIGAPPAMPPAPPVVEVSYDVSEAKNPELDRVQAEVERLHLELRRLQTSVPRTRQDTPAATAAAVAAKPQLTAAARLPLPQPVQSLTDPTMIAAPQLPVAAPAAPVQGSIPTAVPPPPPRKPASGRAIWTGNLPRGAILAIDTRRASTGVLTGQMPSRPSRIRVYPAELLDAGLIVYTPSGQERIEPPNANNGWNLTTWCPDPRRASTVAIIEAPGQTNGWRRLIVRSNGQPISVLMIEWEEIADRSM